MEKRLKTANSELDQIVRHAEKVGPKIVPTRDIIEVLDEIRVTDGHLAALADVSEDIERMYKSYSKLYDELKSKAQYLQEKRRHMASNQST